jgi:hypothetical protein
VEESLRFLPCLFGSTLDVQRSMFDVRLSSWGIALFQSKIASGHASLGCAGFLQVR